MSLKYKIILNVLWVILLIDISCIAFNYSNYMSTNNGYIESLAGTVANTCNLVIDGDKVAGYLGNLQRDTQYYETWNRLIDYRNTNPDIVELSVINFEAIDAIVYPNHTDIYIPLKTSYNIPVAYVIVGISTENFRSDQLIYLLQLTGIVTGITLGFGVLLIM